MSYPYLVVVLSNGHAFIAFNSKTKRIQTDILKSYLDTLNFKDLCPQQPFAGWPLTTSQRELVASFRQPGDEKKINSTKLSAGLSRK